MARQKSNSQILQNFVDNLLEEPGVEFGAPNVVLTETTPELLEPKLLMQTTGSPKETVKAKQSTPNKFTKSSRPDITISATTEKPLVTERLQRARILLKTMPEVTDVIQQPDSSVSLSNVFANENLLKGILDKVNDDIIITDGNQKSENNQQTLQLESAIDEAKIVTSDLLEADALPLPDKVIETIPSPLEDGIPEWGRGTFQSLIINVGELKLAVPLMKLGGIHRIDPEPTPMPEKPDWYLGLIAASSGNISLIDTALWIMPEKYQIAKAKGLDYRFLVLLNESRWGLACTKVDNAILLSEDDIHWNKKSSKHPWLAGMVRKEMCALVDVDTLLMMLQNETTQRNPVSN